MTIDDISRSADRVLQVLDGHPIGKVYAGQSSISGAYIADVRAMAGAVHAFAAVARFEHGATQTRGAPLVSRLYYDDESIAASERDEIRAADVWKRRKARETMRRLFDDDEPFSEPDPDEDDESEDADDE